MSGSVKRKGGIIIYSSFVFFLIILSIRALCQEVSDKKLYFGLELNPTIIPKPKITKEIGNEQILTRSTVGFEVGVKLLYSISKKNYLTIGINYGRLPYSWGLNTSYNSFIYYDKGSTYDIPYWSFPLCFEHCIWLKNKNSITGYFGFNLLNYPPGHSSIGYNYIDSTGNLHRIFIVSLESNFPFKTRLNYQLGGNLNYILKSGAIVKLGIYGNFSFAEIVKGYYEFVPNTPSYTLGTYSMTGSYLGIKANYFFGRKLE